MEDIDKEKMVKDVYYASDGYSSMKNTLEAARTKDKRIKMQDVKAWFNKNVQRTTPLRAQNSYVAPEANFTYAADLFFITEPENLGYKNLAVSDRCMFEILFRSDVKIEDT